MSPWAAASPCSDSLTTASGSFRSFRMLVGVAVAIDLSLLGRDGVDGVRVRYGFLDRLRDPARMRDEVVDERRQGGADEPGQDVDRQELIPVRGAALQRRDELRTERARRVQRGARDGTDDHDD